MKLIMPDYCKNFRCKADKCTDCCCIGWEIDIDSKTEEVYKNSTSCLSEKFKKHIAYGEPSAFILDENERCPFLNDKNLCEIIIYTGEENLCDICREHPRYYEWFDGIKEGGVGMSCEAAAELILNHEGHTDYYETIIPDETADEYDYELYKFMYAAREVILNLAEDSSLTIKQRITAILNYAEILQNNADNNNFSPVTPVICRDVQENRNDIRPLLEFLTELEPIDENWLPYIRKNTELYDRICAENYQNREKYLTNIMVYNIWRYFLKGVFSGEFLSYVKIAVISCVVHDYLFRCICAENGELSPENAVKTAVYYSKEMDYCEENIEKTADMSYELPFLSSEYLSSLI